ncbi:heat shock factor protein 5 isoform X2 [Cottoperca gobio]|uniref:Heat shock factor protein 5 isoform X2 n=1 Tax=Cottoperca gobio TaxID=56716 RepID=A0A6J2R255_COTGO|nr:heat shock factor protein 5 isoform X2 [Cottoperca gobio]
MFCDPDKSMVAGDSSLPDSINPNNFPAKLWRLVNNPLKEAICWDRLGQFIVIDQQLFEKQILSPSSITSDNADAFKTSNFSSFVRQLNLYGFRKADPTIKESGENAACHHFYNHNFKRDQPELVATLRRLTVDNKAKMQAGLNVKSRPPSRFLRFSGDSGDSDNNLKRESSSPSPTHQGTSHPYYPNKAQAMASHNGTPVPPRFLIRGHSAALSTTVFAEDKGIPVSLSSHSHGVPSSSNAVHIQQGILSRSNHGNSNFTYNGANAQYQPSYYSPVCQCYHPNLVASHMAGGGLQTWPLSPHSYYQASYPVNMLSHVDPNQDSKNKEHQEVKKCDINLETIFQIADEVMQTPPNSSLVRVVTPEKPGPELVPISANTLMCDNFASTMKASPLSPITIIMAGSGKDRPVTYAQQEKSVFSIPDQMPEDAIFEVTIDDEKDTAL